METTQKILKLIADETGFPFVAGSLQKILSLTGADATSTRDLVDAILDHIALTERLLKIANSVSVSRGGPSVGTVNGAVLITGFDAVRAISTALLALQGFERYGNRARWLPEFKVALLASQMARRMAARSGFGVAEDCATAALFRGVGRILAAAVAVDETDAVRDTSAAEARSQEAAARAHFGMSYAAITRKALQAWNLPVVLQERAAPAESVGRRGDAEPDDWVQRMSSLAYAMAETADYPPELRERRLQRVNDEYRDLAQDSTEAATALIDGALHDVQKILSIIEPDLDVGIATLAPAVSPAPEQSSEAQVLEPAARAICLTRAVGEMATVMSKSPDLDKIVPIVLESIVRGLAAKRALFVLPNRAFATYEARFAHGASDELMRHFRLDAMRATTIFHVAMASGNDLFISDAEDAKVQAKLPPWFREHFGVVKSFSLMPLSAEKSMRALIYVDFGDRVAEMPSPDVIQALRALKQQTQLALHLVAKV